jgi:hypothetical protein
MDERLSSSLTFISKFFLIPFWLAGGCFILLINHRADPILLIFFLIITACLYWACGRTKKVERIGDNLRISNYFQEIEVPLAEVESVSEARMMRTTLITLTFRQPTIFGDSIVFTPKSNIISRWSHPSMVEQLQAEIDRLRGAKL